MGWEKYKIDRYVVNNVAMSSVVRVRGEVSEKSGKNSNVAKFSVLEDMGISERCGKQCDHERAWRGLWQEDVVFVEKLHFGCLLWLGWGEGGGGLSEKCGTNSKVAKFSVLEDVGISERCGKQCGHERAWRGVYCLSTGRCQRDVV